MKALGIFGLIVVAMFVGLFIVKLAWAWVMPNIFNSAVSAGLVTPSLTLWQAFKITLLLSALGVTRSAASKE